MEEYSIDKALNKLLGMKKSELLKFKPEYVSEEVALQMITASFEGDMRATQMIADRTSGRAAIRESSSSSGDLAAFVREKLGG